MPAHIYGTVPSGATGTFLASYGGITSGGNESVQIVRVDNPLGTPTFTRELVTVGNFDDTGVPFPFTAPQSGTATGIDAGDRRVYNAVWRNNKLYFATTVKPPSGPNVGQATVHWFNINTTNVASLTVNDHGDVGGEDIAIGAHTFYPSVSVDVDETLAIGFSASHSSIFPGAYYTGRRLADAAGTVQSIGTLKLGEASYIRTLGGGVNRWGDYSSMALAPDGRTFWAFNLYAETQGNLFNGENGRWGTMWGRFAFNSPPVVAVPIPDQVVNEDDPPTNIDLIPVFQDTEDLDNLVYTVPINTNPSLVSTSFQAGNLRLTYAANGAGTATITVRATDTFGAFVEDTFTVTVNPFNDAPLLDTGGNMALGNVLEDAVGHTGTLITDLLASAGDRITDPDAGAVEGIAVIAADTASGTWQYTVNGGTDWLALGDVTGTNARLLASDANTRIRFIPGLNFNGTITNAITFRAWDRTSGTNGETADPSVNGGTTAFSTVTETASLIVTAVNDVPSFTKGADQTALEDAGAQTAAGWATAMSSGGRRDEAGQTLTFLVTTNNERCSACCPRSIHATGNLTYTPAANANGTATVTVRLQDNGGTANGGVDRARRRRS